MPHTSNPRILCTSGFHSPIHLFSTWITSKGKFSFDSQFHLLTDCLRCAATLENSLSKS
jgi:transcription initiation factor IIE alpha subunit